jgi:hypothetical protein
LHDGPQHDRPLVPPPDVERYFYDPRHDEPREIGFKPPIPDLHGNVLIPGRLCNPQEEGCNRLFIAGKVFAVDPRKEPLLAGFIRAHKSFKRAKHTDTQLEDRLSKLEQ